MTNTSIDYYFFIFVGGGGGADVVDCLDIVTYLKNIGKLTIK